MKLTIAGYARKIGVSRQVVSEWLRYGRIKAEHPASGVWLIDANEPRPLKMRPWDKERKERIDREKFY
jgi:predicted site-specific integrase-resolvase